MRNDHTYREIEYSKVWANNNPDRFTASILEFLSQHPAIGWKLSMSQTSGFVTLSAALKARGE